MHATEDSKRALSLIHIAVECCERRTIDAVVDYEVSRVSPKVGDGRN